MKISLFTPTHDPQWLPELYASIRAQDHQDWEWVILANGGAKVATFADERVKVVEDLSGVARVGHLKLVACKHCSGEVLLEMDHDDLLAPSALSEVAAAFADPAVDFAYSNTINHDVRTDAPVTWSSHYGWSQRDAEFNGMKCVESVSADPDPQSISRIWFAPNHLRAWRSSFYWRIGGHDASMKISDDHDLICRTYIAGNMRHIDKPLYFYRVHGGNTWLQHQEEIQATMWGVHDRYIQDMALRWTRDAGLRAIDLCGGIGCPKGFESVDRVNADVIADLNEPWPFADGSVGVIRAHDAIEHLRDPITTMNEAWRVLAHGGFMLVLVPSTDGVGAWCDPTHVSFWNWRSFRYYTESAVQQYITSAGAKCRFQKIKVVPLVLYDNVPYVQAHLVAVKEGGKRFYGELLI